MANYPYDLELRGEQLSYGTWTLTAGSPVALEYRRWNDQADADLPHVPAPRTPFQTQIDLSQLGNNDYCEMGHAYTFVNADPVYFRLPFVVGGVDVAADQDVGILATADGTNWNCVVGLRLLAAGGFKVFGNVGTSITAGTVGSTIYETGNLYWLVGKYTPSSASVGQLWAKILTAAEAAETDFSTAPTSSAPWAAASYEFQITGGTPGGLSNWIEFGAFAPATCAINAGFLVFPGGFAMDEAEFPIVLDAGSRELYLETSQQLFVGAGKLESLEGLPVGTGETWEVYDTDRGEDGALVQNLKRKIIAQSATDIPVALGMPLHCTRGCYVKFAASTGNTSRARATVSAREPWPIAKAG